MPIRRLEDTLTATTATVEANDLASTALASVEHVKPHIQPGVLQPAVQGKLLDGTTSHGSNGNTAYGTAQADGHSYYYTFFKGSKPIKDPRIGAHFGSQRHRFTSSQILHSETAAMGNDVSSIDGREWIRGQKLLEKNDARGTFFHFNTGGDDTIEVVGYFMDLNILTSVNDGTRTVQIQLDGVQKQAALALGATKNTPYLTGSRYRNEFSIRNAGLGTTALGIHTVRITRVAGNTYIYGVELIAQDTSNRNKIQIPSQNVVSYGKKFSIGGSSAATHYDPFNGFTSGNATALAAKIDTGTSLGMANWLHSSTYYRPYNGGRVVKWVASDGTIKTSVTMMSPNAQNIAGSAISAKANASVANNTYLPTFSGAIDHSLNEIAKVFHVCEFGNGAANLGTNGAWADVSMLRDASDDIAYVMDDGLTSLSADDYQIQYEHETEMKAYANDDQATLTFIGTGLAIDVGTSGVKNVAQNLPYGTHIFNTYRTSTSAATAKLDGVTLRTNHADFDRGIIGPNVYIYQPKKPPIPENACIIADYMLMADHVIQTTVTEQEGHISKGIRWVSGSRDHDFDSAQNMTSPVLHRPDLHWGGLSGAASPTSGGETMSAKLPFFGTNAQVSVQGANDVSHQVFLDELGTQTAKTETNVDSSDGNSQTDIITLADNQKVTLANTKVETTVVYNGYNYWGTGVVTPIHTSSHYQSFETPYLSELVGGDRNMEQNNLVVTPDGKTWDEVTRDTSYIGLEVLNTMNTDGNHASYIAIFDEWRGAKTNRTGYNFYKTDYVVWAYNRAIILKDGQYRISREARMVDSYPNSNVYLNGSAQAQYLTGAHNTRGSWEHHHTSVNIQLKRGDYLQVRGYSGGTSSPGEGFSIERIR